MTQAEVAELAGISLRTYRNWESGKAVPYPGWRRRRVVEILRTDVDFLLLGVRKDSDAFD